MPFSRKSVFVILFLLPLMMSCISLEPAVDLKDVFLAFEEVYNFYKPEFILEDAQTYQVEEGDTLPAIIRRVYGAGNGYFFPLIILASNDVILDPDLLESGMELKIPNLQENLDDPDTRDALIDLLYDVADVYEKKEAAEVEKNKKQLAADLKNRLRYQADFLCIF
jgi:hypothetical protein